MKIVGIIQARMGATRLPGKVLKTLGGKTILAQVIARVQACSLIDEVVVATTTEPHDAPIVEEAERCGAGSFRGSEADVLDRFYQAAKAFQADAIVRATADNPFTDPGVLERSIREFLEHQPDAEYVSSFLPCRRYPYGVEAEVVRFDALERVWREAEEPAYREHVTPYFAHNTDRYGVHGMVNDFDYSQYRWTVDTPEDYAFVTRIYDHFGAKPFLWRDVVALLEQNPDWMQLNRSIQQKAV